MLPVTGLQRHWCDAHAIITYDPYRLFKVTCSIFCAAAVVHSHIDVYFILFVCKLIILAQRLFIMTFKPYKTPNLLFAN